MTSAVKSHNLRLIDLPGVDDNVFVLASDTKFLWFGIDSGEAPDMLMDEEALEQSGYAILALLDVNAELLETIRTLKEELEKASD